MGVSGQCALVSFQRRLTAWPTLHKSKEELIAVAQHLGDEGLIELVDQIGRSADSLEELHKLRASAECRIMCAYASLGATDENEP